MTIPLPSRYRLDPDLMTWVGRCETLPDINFLFAANQFIQAGKAAGWWDLLSAIYFFCAPTQQAALQNVKGNRFNLVVNTSGSDSSPPSFAPYVGVWSGADQSVYTAGASIEDICGPGIASHNMIGVYNNSVSIYDYKNAASIGDTTLYGQVGASNSPVQTTINMNASAEALGVAATARIWNNAPEAADFIVITLPDSNCSGPGLGLACNIRTSSNGGIFWSPGTQTYNWTNKGTNTPPTGNGANLYFLTAHIATDSYCPNPIAFGFAGPFATEYPADMALSLSNACDDFVRALGTYVNPINPPLAPNPPPCFASGATATALAGTPGLSRIFRLEVPPQSDDDETYTYYPVTDCATDPSSGKVKSTTQTRVGIWHLMTPDKALGGSGPIYPAHDQKANDTLGITNSAGVACAVQFNTYDQAIGATLVKLMYSAGYLDRDDPDGANIAALLYQYGYLTTPTSTLGWLDAADAFLFDTARWGGSSQEDLYTDQNVDTTSEAYPGGPAVVHNAYAVANKDTFFCAPYQGAAGNTQKSPASSYIAPNMVVLPAARLCDLTNPALQSTPQPIRGFFLDFEIDDNRGEARAPDGKTDLFTVTCLLLAAAAHGKGLSVGGGLDPLNDDGRFAGLTPANAGIALADPSPAYPAGGLDFLNIVTTNAPVPAADPTSDLEADYLQAQLDIYQSAAPAVANLASKLLMQFVLDAPYLEINRLYSASARRFLTSNAIANVSIIGSTDYFGGALSRPVNQAIATFLGMPIF